MVWGLGFAFRFGCGCAVDFGGLRILVFVGHACVGAFAGCFGWVLVLVLALGLSCLILGLGGV